MRIAALIRAALLMDIILILTQPVSGQELDLNYFINNALKNDAAIRQNVNQQQFYGLQAQLINAQNKAPQVNFTSDYLFAPYFGNNGKAIAITANPSSKAFGYDIGQTNGGMYATQLNVTLQLLNKRTINSLQEQNTNDAALNNNSRVQLEHDLRKSITDQYIQVYQLQQQEEYLVRIVDEVKGRKATVEALVKKGLLQQSDYLLLEIEQNTRENELSQAKITEVDAYGALKNLAIVSDTTMVQLSAPLININAAPQNYFYKEKFKLDSLSIIAQQNVFNAKYRPTLDLAGNGGMLASDFNSIPHNIGMQAALHLAIPIFDGHQRKINDSQVKISQQSITYARDNFTVQQRNYLQSLMQQIHLLNQSITQIQQLISKQDLLLRLDREKLQGGQLSIIEYVKSLQDYAAAKQNLNGAKVQLLLLTNQYNYYNW
ncbi:TolC family protein [Mucilaginibacter sabulilitoris]|uniref:TolC family protein n=1 Tax=Mucilaginibacter sabulilitoris TaxID=1173583 RepID=A0ABZ0TFX5_9SPHI|nr:TolC family protein [Mucilaginibacter sabulilitoris]WPU91476.1 TolC family protein [Mucilaginibacter sabulilitoris]